jgi:hypothetical protein
VVLPSFFIIAPAISGSLKVAFANPFDVSNSITLVNGTSGSGNFGSYTTIACTNTSVKFSAKECDVTDNIGCNYYDNIPNTKERIVADCYGNTTLINGDYNYLNPVVYCPYDDTEANYSVTLYVQSTLNTSNYRAYNHVPIIISVKNGVNGITCGINPVTPTTPPSNGTNTTNVTTGEPNAIGGGIDNFFDMLTGGANSSKSFKLMIGILIILGCVIGVSFYVTNFAVIMIVGVLSLVFTTAIGLIPLYILILCIILMIGGIMLNNFIYCSNGYIIFFTVWIYN